MAPAAKKAPARRTTTVKRKPAVKRTTVKRKPAARKPAAKAGSYQALMSKELKALKTKYNYKTGATTNRVAWSTIFQEAAANVAAKR